MTDRWQIIFEVTLDIKDNESSFIALERAKIAMDELLGKEIAHYHVLAKPKMAVEFD